MNHYFVYIVSNKHNTVVYIGVTSDLERRVYEHKQKVNKGFTSKYNCNKLVWFEEFNDINEAISREKQLKNWKRDWKNKLIEQANSDWLDLSKEWYDVEDTGSDKV